MIIGHIPSHPGLEFPQKEPQNRQKLLAIYQKLDQNDPQRISWNSRSHMGLLNLSLKNEEAAFSLWKSTLDISPQGEDAAQASGYMLTTYEKGKRWQELEDFAKYCVSKQIRPKRIKKFLNLTDIIASSLI